MVDRTKDDHKNKLQETLGRMLQDHNAWKNKQEAKLWQEMTVPCGLAELLSHLTKEELTTIRSNLGLQNMSTLKKQDLANKLVEQIPQEIEAVLELMDKERYSLLRSICDNGGWMHLLPNREADPEKVEYYRGLGLIFTGSVQGKRALVVPLELVEVFQALDNDQEWRQQIRLNTEWIKLSHGMLHYYGVLSREQLMLKLGELTDSDPEYSQLFFLLLDAENYYGQVNRRDGQYYCDSLVEDHQEILQEHESRKALEYYPFTKEELLKAGEGDYFNRNPAFKRLTKFLLDNYRIKRVEAEEIVVDCQDMIRENLQMDEVIQYLGNRLEFPSLEMVQLLTGEVANFMNNTRLWVLKGHTPQEVLKLEQKTLLPLPATVDKGQKVGRNEPCPCGSGKKYKKCCGDTGNVVHLSFSHNKVAEAGEDQLLRVDQLGGIGKPENTEGPRFYQLMVSLKDIQPPIWRRLLVPADITFFKLHKIIQAAFGWQDYHLFDFNFGDTVVHLPDPEAIPATGQLQRVNQLNAKRTMLEALLQDRGKCVYTYDFGDSWEHQIILEQVVQETNHPRSPVCLEGSRHRPPEDVGGVHGYEDFLAAISDPQHPEYDNYLIWAEKDTGGRKFDPEYFYLREVNKALAKVKC